ncbi:AIPR family protein [Pectobacterium carotovorum]|uniref:AIPR family protein n=1 Tax=Pectobacterium carotovorum TaxID=554 RepID=UPI0038253B47
MARNDTILLDGIIEDRAGKVTSSSARGEIFEKFSFEQILKEFDLDNDELNSGWVDGGHDGGIDGFYLFLNGHLIQDFDDVLWPKKNAELIIYIITCKHHDTYKQAVLESLISTINELFDFRVLEGDLNGSYNNEVLKKRKTLINCYKKISTILTSLEIRFYYASRGETTDIGDSVINRSQQIKKITQDSFGESLVSFNFMGAKELIHAFRQVPKSTLELPYIDSLSRGERYILIVKLIDYYNFLRNDENNTLRRYLFDSNVRDFMGLNFVNEDIKKTLISGDSPDFWLLNNGVTILATSAKLIGQSINMEDIQIVNGLQTSESIFRYFSSGGSDIKDRAVMIKVIVSKEEKVRDQIIRATNSQTAVEQSSLHATEKIQRDIEDILLRHGFHYERRKNYYKNQSVDPDTILTPLYIAGGYITLVLRNPYQAGRFKSRHLRNEKIYGEIFSEKNALTYWPAICSIMKKCDNFLLNLKINKGGEGFLKKWRHVLAIGTLAIKFGRFDYSLTDLTRIEFDDGFHKNISTCWEEINKIDQSFVKVNSRKLNKSNLILILKYLSSAFEIKSFECVERRNILNETFFNDGVKTNKKKITLTEDFILLVEKTLPKQPWKPGMHREVMKELDCTNQELHHAMTLLIERGKLFKQQGGVLYDLNNVIVGYDKERLDKSPEQSK